MWKTVKHLGRVTVRWFNVKLAERTSQASVAALILLGAAIADGTMEWRSAIKPAAAALIIFLFRENPLQPDGTPTMVPNPAAAPALDPAPVPIPGDAK